jgi:hypothetical protein
LFDLKSVWFFGACNWTVQRAFVRRAISHTVWPLHMHMIVHPWVAFRKMKCVCVCGYKAYQHLPWGTLLLSLTSRRVWLPSLLTSYSGQSFYWHTYSELLPGHPVPGRYNHEQLNNSGNLKGFISKTIHEQSGYKIQTSIKENKSTALHQRLNQDYNILLWNYNYLHITIVNAGLMARYGAWNN